MNPDDPDLMYNDFVQIEKPSSMKRATRAAKIELLMRTAQDVGWLLLAILAPLVVNFWGQQPFELPKATLVRTLVWYLVALFVVRRLFAGPSLRRELRQNPLTIPLAVLALVIVVTTATAADWRLSLWGSYERSQGALTLLSYLLLCFLAAAQLRSLSRARTLLATMVLTAVPIAFLGLLQSLGWNPFALISDARSPVYATLGRANFVAAYLVILLPLTLGLLLTLRRRTHRITLAMLLLAEVLVLVLTASRSAWLAAVFSLALFALLWFPRALSRCGRQLAWIAVSALFFSGPLLVFVLGPLQMGSIAARLVIWRQTASLVLQRPLLGYGPDSLGLVFHAVYPPELVYYQGRDYFVDRAHNLLLDWLASSGLPGLLAFLFVFVTFVLLLCRALRRPLPSRKRALLVAILAAVLGNVANNLTSFDVTPTATAVWLLMGVGVGLARPAPNEVLSPRKAPGARRLLFVACLFTIITLAVWRLNARPLLADVAARSAQRQAQRGNLDAALSAAEMAVLRWSPEPAHHRLLGQILWQQARAHPKSVEVWLSRSESAFLAARDRRPVDPAYWLALAQFYNATVGQADGAAERRADEAFRQALALSPNRAAIYTAWGRAHVQRGHPQHALPLLSHALQLDETDEQAFLALNAARQALGLPLAPPPAAQAADAGPP